MSSVEKLKDEFMLYEVEQAPTALIGTHVLLDVFIGDMEETVKSSKVAVAENFRDEQVTKVKNFFLDLFGYEEENLEQFDRDTGVVLRISCLADRYKNFFERMKAVTDNDNYGDVYRLAMFTYDSFTSNYHYLESLRDSIRFAVDGVTYYGTGEDTQSDFVEFFEETLPSLVSDKKVYKK